MNICLVGVNHRTAPVAIREKVAIRAGRLNEALQLLRSHVSPGLILSTCNRTEVYTATSGASYAEAAILAFLRTHLDAPEATLLKHTYVLNDKAACEHLFRTACGLDSMIVGEYEVLGQVRQSLEAADKSRMVNLPLRHLFQRAIRIGRRVREETEISKNALSVSSVAVDLATEVIGDLTSCKMLVIGAGEAGRVAAKAAKDRGVSRITVVSRTKERASKLATALGGQPVSMDRLVEELDSCSLVMACADAPHYLLDIPQIETVMKRRPGLPLVIIDIAVPRNVAPAVSQIKNVFLHNIDALSLVAEQNRKQREGETQRVAEIITAEMTEFSTWWQTFEVRPVVRALMKKAEEVRYSQLNKTLKRLRPLSDEERDSLEAMTKSIVTKLLQDPINYLKTNANNNGQYAELVNKLLGLEVEN
ncbi:MAG: glutamyl-tRNA reductase [Dehalococcoidales bacterium]|jgi:glutamyl-tRNA reductase|nr:glutamyl-tRNA reductase [Dehalococcoidales bacterium]MDP6448992.1 glutamyl-tRNA reductase [Dehalococcoidales bacterium]MDP6576314.1 glutamyl-tRNA reductase [Dehalococcoidales bacterium]MDP6824515.1 glutamyl-tRNA reductase [Dehalococcoidales bacterium]|tara:strand:+ start:5713 stop:6972 length:1260 start_codon:yes stop_codon:yes gene_type:complete